MDSETRRIREIAKRLDEAAGSVPNEAPWFLDLKSIAFELTFLADEIDQKGTE